MDSKESLGYGAQQEQSRNVKLMGTGINTDEGVICRLDGKEVCIDEKGEFEFIDSDGIKKMGRVQQWPNEKGIMQEVNLSLIRALDALYSDVELVYCGKKGNYYVYDWIIGSESQNILINPENNIALIEDPKDGRLKRVQILGERVNKTTGEVVNKRELGIGDKLIGLKFKVLEVMPCNSSAKSDGDDMGGDSQPY